MEEKKEQVYEQLYIGFPIAEIKRLNKYEIALFMFAVVISTLLGTLTIPII